MAARKITPLDPADNGPASIQGIAQRARRETLWASPAEVATYAQGQPDGVIACRERGRHDYPATRLTLADPDAPPFTEVTPEGWYVRRLPCESCRHRNDDGTPGLPRVVRIEEWELKHRRGVVQSAQIVRARPLALDPDYLNPKGQGRIKPSQVRSAVVTARVAGMRIKDIRNQVRTLTEAREDAAREAYARAHLARAEQDAAELNRGLSVIDGGNAS
jgi:hypothetical protein